MQFVDWLVSKLSNLKSGKHDYFAVGLLLGGFISAVAYSGIAVLVGIFYGIYLFYVESRQSVIDKETDNA